MLAAAADIDVVGEAIATRVVIRSRTTVTVVAVPGIATA
jgi:hypothetical protein